MINDGCRIVCDFFVLECQLASLFEPLRRQGPPLPTPATLACAMSCRSSGARFARARVRRLHLYSRRRWRSSRARSRRSSADLWREGGRRAQTGGSRTSSPRSRLRSRLRRERRPRRNPRRARRSAEGKAGGVAPKTGPHPSASARTCRPYTRREIWNRITTKRGARHHSAQSDWRPSTMISPGDETSRT